MVPTVRSLLQMYSHGPTIGLCEYICARSRLIGQSNYSSRYKKLQHCYLSDLIVFDRYCCSYQSGLDLVASGRVDVKKLITHRYILEQTEDAYKTASAGEGIKVMISSARG